MKTGSFANAQDDTINFSLKTRSPFLPSRFKKYLTPAQAIFLLKRAMQDLADQPPSNVPEMSVSALAFSLKRTL